MRKESLVLVLFLAAPCAEAQNLLPDPAFSSGVSGWTVTGVGSPTFQWSNAAGPDGQPGIARLQFLGPGSGIAQYCVPVVAGKTYSWGASFFANTAGGQVRLEFMPNATCAGFVVVGAIGGPFASTGVGAWQFEPGPDVVAPPTSGSVLFRVLATTGASTSSTLDVDNVYFGPQGAGPPGVRDVPALSRGVLLALALVLAAAGMRLVRTL